MTGSGISVACEGTVSHVRYGSVEHHFTYPLFMMFLAQDELGDLDRIHPLWSFLGKPNWFFFRRQDYLDKKSGSIIDSIKDLLIKKGFSESANNIGHVNMLTHMRYVGYCYNPVTFYLAYVDKSDTNPVFIIVDINNTPWDERYPYILRVPDNAEMPLTFHVNKDFHVSPFYPMSLSYDCRFDFQGEKIKIEMTSFKGEEKCFKANLQLKKITLSRRVMTKLLFKYPCVTAKTMLAIYWQACKLFLKGATFYVHPKKKEFN